MIVKRHAARNLVGSMVGSAPTILALLDAPDNFDHDARSFRRGGWWQHAVDEAKAIREGVGLVDATAFTKHVVKGPGCDRIPRLVHL